MDPFREQVPTEGVLPRAANPFRPGAGKVPPAFGGRTAPLMAAKTVVDRLAVPADPVDLPLFRGFRGTGKTALMAYARRHAEDGGTVTLHIEADPSDSTLAATCATLARDAAPLTTDVAGAVARRLAALDLKGRVEFHPTSETDPGSNIEALLHDLVLLGDARGVGILLTVDEAHEAEQLLLRPMIRAVHRHAQDARPFGVMISGLPGVADTLMAEGQTYTERLTSFDLGLLTGPVPPTRSASRSARTPTSRSPTRRSMRSTPTPPATRGSCSCGAPTSGTRSRTTGRSRATTSRWHSRT